MMAQKSVLLVTVDCLRADHTGFMGYPRPTTPFLDGLAAESFVFPAAIVAGAPTYYSLPALLASRYPLALGRDVIGLAPEEPNLASGFRQAGYATAFFGAGNPYISSRFGYDFGFDTFRDFLDRESAAHPGSDRSAPVADGWLSQLNRRLQKIRPHLGALGSAYDELYFQYCQIRTAIPGSLNELRRFPAADVIVDHARSWLASVGERPFFLWLHLMDPHSPYYPVEKAVEQMGQPPITPFRARYLNSSWNRSDLSAKRFARHRDEIVALYDAGIRWVDTQMARLVEILSHLGMWDRCIFALTADHGEEFLDHGGRYHPPTRLREELIRVPLLLRVAGAPKREVSQAPFSMVDLAPTLLDAAGVPSPSSFRGHRGWESLRNGLGRDEAAISESVADCTNPFYRRNRLGSRALSIRESRFKLALNFADASECLYDLEADPGERTPLPLNAEKAVRRRLLERAREHLRQSAAERDETMRLYSQLRDLRLDGLCLEKSADSGSCRSNAAHFDHPLQLQFPNAKAS
ncbi:MAG: sulfatase [Candidatus Sulfotelmatobacter sp.]